MKMTQIGETKSSTPAKGGNDRKTRQQIADQILDGGNFSLARNVVEGIPVRVIRGHQLASAYAPPLGYRYDGLYRVETFWHARGKSGHRIYRFRLRKLGSTDRDLLPEPLSLSIREEKETYGEVPAPRQRIEISRIIRNSDAARAVKQMHDYTCQVCGNRLETPAGPYAEAGHIRPLGAPHHGPDTVENILCLCPNCHVLFDTGALTFEEDGHIVGTSNVLRSAKGHAINPEYLRYHREHYGH